MCVGEYRLAIRWNWNRKQPLHLYECKKPSPLVDAYGQRPRDLSTFFRISPVIDLPAFPT